MKITVLGAIVIVAAVAASILLVLVLNEKMNKIQSQQNNSLLMDQTPASGEAEDYAI